jgi:hypothetical protein
MARHWIGRYVPGLSVALVACGGQSSPGEEWAMAGTGRRQRSDSAQAVARACELVRTFVSRDSVALCQVERFLSTPEEYVIRVRIKPHRIKPQAKASTQAAEVRLAKEGREATVRVIPNL